jgi:hypothetical protein
LQGRESDSYHARIRTDNQRVHHIRPDNPIDFLAKCLIATNPRNPMAQTDTEKMLVESLKQRFDEKENRTHQ